MIKRRNTPHTAYVIIAVVGLAVVNTSKLGNGKRLDMSELNLGIRLNHIKNCFGVTS